MNDTVSISFGIPRHGWLPAYFVFNDFKLDIDASDVLNDPVEEIYNSIIGLEQDKAGQVVWWLEPHTYFFYFERTNDKYILTISEADDIDQDEKRTIKVIHGNYRQIIAPFKKALIDFCQQTHEESDWPYTLDNNKLALLQLD